MKTLEMLKKEVTEKEFDNYLKSFFRLNATAKTETEKEDKEKRMNDYKALSEREKLLIAVYHEVALALDTNKHVAILQYNYKFAKSATANLYNLIRFVDVQNSAKAVTNIYVSIVKGEVQLKLTVTAEKLFQTDLAKLQYNTVKHFKYCKLENVTEEVKLLYAVLKVQAGERVQEKKKTEKKKEEVKEEKTE